MSLVFNMVGVGAEPNLFAVVVAQTSSNSMDVPSSITWSSYDSDYFSRGTGNARFVCKRAGTYRIRLSARSTYPASSSNRTTCTARIYINGAYGTREITSSASSSVYTDANYTVSLAVGDLVSLNAKNSNGTALVPVNMCITAPA